MLNLASLPQFAALCSPAPAPNAALWSQLPRRSIAGITGAGFPKPNWRWVFADFPKRNAGAGDPCWRPGRPTNHEGIAPQGRYRPFMPVAKNRQKLVHVGQCALKADAARRYLDSNGRAPATQQAWLLVPEHPILKPAAYAVQRTSKRKPVESSASMPGPNPRGVRRGELRP